ncbi:unnamed protein product [Cyclocybe aegerita]|uniref:Uncharacterized protein n=1 Tax=Cyclocybe aegerita TaxID=1973307 RepID=A0A8S0W0D3_CYCAE|nr:unnamed protein product [Cyclocybe aegerita]
MTTTPKKLVHWEVDSPSFSNLNSPFFNVIHESSIVSTSTLEFLNAQLVAHGFVPSPGISLDGVTNEESARVVKCLLALLSQRVEDMSRTEDLATKVRTVSYDLERMRSMQRAGAEKAANAEREMNLHKSKMTTALKSLQSSENAHRQTTAELQRTRTLMQGLRATHQAELKKKEKDVEKITEKWQKVSDTQAKLATMQSGIRCANAAVVEGTEVLGRGPGFLDIALEQAEQARSHLSDENLFLRKLMLRTVNDVQSILHQAQSSLSGDQILEEPSQITMTALFPVAPPTAASDKVDSMTTALREALTTLSEPKSPASAPTTIEKPPSVPDGEIGRLQEVIAKLKDELARSQKQSMAHMVETQAMFDKFAEDHRIATGEIGEMSVELLSAPLRDQERDRLDILRRELDAERQKFTEAAVRFGKEKASFEAERLRFLDERRSWEVEKMLSDLPPTPMPISPRKPSTNAFRISPKKSPRKSPHQSPRKSPAKRVNVGKAGSGRRAHRVSRRSSAGSPLKVVLSYETELIPPPLPAPAFPLMKSLGLGPSSLLPTSFVLPPPSPRASLPTKPALPLPMPGSPPKTTSTDTPETSPPSIPAQPTITPSTPPAARRSFPVAKPFAARMIHAYSPAKPSPLSRILMLADSPVTPPNGFLSNTSLSPSSGPLEAVAEEPEDGGLGPIPPQLQRQMSLAEELGVPESPPDTPLQEKKVEANVAAPLPRGRVFFPEAQVKKPLTTVEKGKAKAEPTARARTSAVGEKENNQSLKPAKAPSGRSGKVSPVPPLSNATGAAKKVSPAGANKPAPKSVLKAPPASSTAGGSRAKVPPKPSMNGGGPRRVLINSADAPPIGKGWKG